MNIEEFREYCLQLSDVEECFPFDEKTLVFKVKGKMFALTNLYDPDFKIILKCEAEYSLELRENYSEIQPGYHMNKKYWNTVFMNGNLTDDFIKNLIKLSYTEVLKKITKKR